MNNQTSELELENETPKLKLTEMLVPTCEGCYYFKFPTENCVERIRKCSPMRSGRHFIFKEIQ